MLFGALVPFLLLSCVYVYCRQTEPWPMHDHSIGQGVNGGRQPRGNISTRTLPELQTSLYSMVSFLWEYMTIYSPF